MCDVFRMRVAIGLSQDCDSGITAGRFIGTSATLTGKLWLMDNPTSATGAAAHRHHPVLRALTQKYTKHDHQIFGHGGSCQWRRPLAVSYLTRSVRGPDTECACAFRRLSCWPDFGPHLGWKTSGSGGIFRECKRDSRSCYPLQCWQLQFCWCSAANFTPMVLTA